MHLDLDGSFLAVGGGIDFDHARGERLVGIGVGNYLRRFAHRDLPDIALVDIDFGAHVLGVGELHDVGGAAAGLNLSAEVNRVAQLAIFNEHDSVDGRSNHA